MQLPHHELSSGVWWCLGFKYLCAIGGGIVSAGVTWGNLDINFLMHLRFPRRHERILEVFEIMLWIICAGALFERVSVT